MAVTLAATDHGGDGPPLVVLHGLFGSARNWATLGKRLAATHRVHALDLRNHGGSPWAETMTYPEMAADVIAHLDAAGWQRAALLGHSMGGKVAMAAALHHPGRIERLVVADIAPVPYPPQRLATVEAMQALDLARIARRGDADAALAEAVPDAGERQFLLQNLVLEGGGARWRLNLAAIAADMDAISGFPVPPGAAYHGPALFVAGGRSDYVRPEHEATIRTLFPRAQLARIAEAGHWLHAERPAEFLATVAPFLGAGG
jgi:pimeloyl-ACP methyl ester carboxylesterase